MLCIYGYIYIYIYVFVYPYIYIYIYIYISGKHLSHQVIVLEWARIKRQSPDWKTANDSFQSPSRPSENTFIWHWSQGSVVRRLPCGYSPPCANFAKTSGIDLQKALGDPRKPTNKAWDKPWFWRVRLWKVRQMPESIFRWSHIYIYIYINTYTQTCVYKHIYIYIYMYIYTHVYTCIHIYICIYM